MSQNLDESPNAIASVAYTELDPIQQQQRLQELAAVFLKLGAIGFGGPAAHIALMDDEIVKRRRWMSHEQLLDLLGVTNLLPGPNSTELAIHIGLERGGWRGLLIAGSCFILPAMSIVWILAAFYTRYQTLPQANWLLYGIKPVIIAIVAQALWKLGCKAAKDIPTAIAGIVVVVAYFFGMNEIVMLVSAGVIVMLIQNWRRIKSNPLGAWVLPLPGTLAQVGGITPVEPPHWFSVFLFFLKIGSVLYGSGYVLLAFLQAELVEQTQWLTSDQLLDAIAIGQFTPGPVSTTATFIGYLLAGNAGAIAGTIGIFLPAFLLVGIVNPWIPKLRTSPWAGGFLDGVNAASLGLMAAVTYVLGISAVIDWLSAMIAVISLLIILRFRVNSAWLVLAGGVIGYLSQWS